MTTIEKVNFKQDESYSEKAICVVAVKDAFIYFTTNINLPRGLMGALEML